MSSDHDDGDPVDLGTDVDVPASPSKPGMQIGWVSVGAVVLLLAIGISFGVFMGQARGELIVRREQVRDLTTTIATLESKNAVLNNSVIDAGQVSPVMTERLFNAVLTMAINPTELQVADALVDLNANSQDVILGLAGQQVNLNKMAIENQTNLQMALLDNWPANYPPDFVGNDTGFSTSNVNNFSPQIGENGRGYYGSVPWCRQGCLVDIGNDVYDPSRSF